MGSGDRTHAHPDQGLRGTVVDYFGYRRLSADAFAPDENQSVISVFLCFPDSAAGTPSGLTADRPADPAGGLPVIDRGYCALRVDLTPMGAGRLIGVAPEKLRDGHHDVATVFGPEAVRLMRQLGSTTSWHVRFGTVDKFLVAQLKNARPRSLSVGAAWRDFAESVGTIVIGELAWVPGTAAPTESVPTHREPTSAGVPEDPTPSPHGAVQAGWVAPATQPPRTTPEG